jgi:type IV secretion system protein VirB9
MILSSTRARARLAIVAACATFFAALQSPAQELDAKEAKAARLSGEWRASSGTVTKGKAGKVVFLYGQVQPSVLCSPLQVCDIELQAGEVVSDVLIGDTVRWKVEPATSGSAAGQRIHLVIKPSEPGLVTSMVVTTTRRTYHIQLKSHRTRYMARVGFVYPEDVNQKLAAVNARLEASIIPGAGVPAETLDFNYRTRGKAPWKPTRVYSDGAKTYIQFPSSLAGRDAPVLFVISGGRNRIVNYRFKGSMMIVDYLIDRAVLVSGVGWKREKVTIRREGR